MSIRLAAAGGSVIGAVHRSSGRNCQDAWATASDGENYAIAVIADGCGSQPHSDVGAKLAVADMASYLAYHWQDFASDISPANEAMVKAHANDVLNQFVENLHNCMYNKKLFHEYGLFTMLFCIATMPEQRVIAMNAGDGYFASYGRSGRNELSVLTADNNSPEYFGYNVMYHDRGLSRFSTIVDRRFEPGESFVIATDGVHDTPEPDLSEFMNGLASTDTNFSSNHAISHRLARANACKMSIDYDARRVTRQRAAFSDDVAVGIVRIFA